MAKTVRSLKGDMVNFDLFTIKAQMTAAPTNDNVIKREKFVNKKRRRSVANKIEKMTQTKALEEKNFDAAVAAEIATAAAAVTVAEVEPAATPEKASEPVGRKRRVVP